MGKTPEEDHRGAFDTSWMCANMLGSVRGVSLLQHETWCMYNS